MADLQCPAIVILSTTADPPPGENLAGVIHAPGDAAALRRAIDALSDLHRGETVLVVAAAEVIADLLGLRCTFARLSIDSAGWRMLSSTNVPRRPSAPA